MKNTAPMTQKWKLIRLSRGKATSLAPSCIGSTKLPIAAGIDGMITRKIITAPCSVNIWLYWSWLMIVGPGLQSSARTINAMMPPRNRATKMPTRYIMPMRLWSSVKAQDMKPRLQLR